MRLLENQLIQFKGTFITLSQLEEMVGRPETYEEFAEIVQQLVERNVLQPVKSAGLTIQTPRLSYKYKILKHSAKKTLREIIERAQLTLHSSISLDAYYRLTQEQLEQDMQFIKKINNYVVTHGLPIVPAPAPERSQQLVGDEKWIQHKGGRRVLERLGLWFSMQIVDVKEPLRFAVHPKNTGRKEQYHLIVENKTTYEALLPVLTETYFSTLIYGAGYEIVGNLSLFDKQYPLPHVTHTFYYFGDLDFSGISIWYLLQEQQEIKLALPFYDAALNDEGKQIPKQQLKDEEAIGQFIKQLSEASRQKCQQLLDKRFYISQEVLVTSELQEIWKAMSDKLMEESNEITF